MLDLINHLNYFSLKPPKDNTKKELLWNVAPKLSCKLSEKNLILSWERLGDLWRAKITTYLFANFNFQTNILIYVIAILDIYW